MVSLWSETSSRSRSTSAPLSRCHTSFTDAATFFDSLSARLKLSAPSGAIAAGSSMVSGSSRALEITRRILGTAVSTAPSAVCARISGCTR